MDLPCRICYLFMVLLCHHITWGNARTALLVIDVQNCFLPGGSLEVGEGAQVIPVINSIRDQFDVVVLTQDWHCPQHISFASQHPGNNNFDVISLNYDETGHLCGKQCTSNQIKHQINQTLWPDHCVMDTNGAAIHVDLIKRLESDLIIRKGSNCEVDSYSAFYNNGGFSSTELESKLIELGVHKVFVTGLALDFCVFYSAMDADHLGFETYVVKDATRGISESGVELAIQQMKENDIKIINSHELKNFIHKTNSIAFNGNGQVQKSFNYVLINLLVIVTTYYL